MSDQPTDLIALVNRLDGMLTVLRESIRNDINDLKLSVEKHAPQKELDALEHRVENSIKQLERRIANVEKQLNERENAFGVLAALRKNWRFIFITLCGFSLVGAYIHLGLSDLHTIALAHEMAMH